MVIAQRAARRLALHAVVVAATAATGRPRTHPTLRRGAAVAVVASAGPAVAQDRAGREPDHPFRTRLPKCWRSRQSVKALRRG
jgi:hypothetical protein